MFSKLEVVITKKRSKYQALCTSFPQCIGNGKTEPLALENLCEVIADHIKNTTKDSFKNILLSPHYTEILFDTSKAKKEHRRVFNLDLPESQQERMLYLKLQGTKTPSEPQERPQFRESFLHLSNSESELGIAEPPVNGVAIMSNLLSYNQADGYLFGFPLNFN